MGVVVNRRDIRAVSLETGGITWVSDSVRLFFFHRQRIYFQTLFFFPLYSVAGVWGIDVLGGEIQLEDAQQLSLCYALTCLFLYFYHRWLDFC